LVPGLPRSSSKPEAAGHVPAALRDKQVIGWHRHRSEGSYLLFHAFYTTKADGMGVRPSISRSIVEARGGRISASGMAAPAHCLQPRVPKAHRDSDRAEFEN